MTTPNTRAATVAALDAATPSKVRKPSAKPAAAKKPATPQVPALDGMTPLGVTPKETPAAKPAKEPKPAAERLIYRIEVRSDALPADGGGAIMTDGRVFRHPANAKEAAAKMTQNALFSGDYRLVVVSYPADAETRDWRPEEGTALCAADASHLYGANNAKKS